MRREFILHTRLNHSDANPAPHDRSAVVGLDGIELAVGDASPPAVHGTHGITPASVRCLSGLIDPTRPEEASERLGSLLSAAAAWRAGTLNVSLSPVDRAFSSGHAAATFLAALYRSLRFEAESAGVAIAIEAESLAGLMSAEDLRAVIDDACSWTAGACVAAVGPSVADACRFVRTLNRRVCCVRIHAAGFADVEVLRALAAALCDIQYGGPVSCIVPVGGEAAARVAMELLEDDQRDQA